MEKTGLIMNVISEDNIDLDNVISSLEAGDTIVYPTETCYGLGCDATNQQAVDDIFAIKHRQKEKSVLVVAPDMSMMIDHIKWTPALEEIANQYWPGPLTVVVDVLSTSDLAEGVIAADGTIAFRITDHALAKELSEKLGKPLVSTSANLSALQSPYDIADVLTMFEGQDHQPDMVIDAGKLPHKSPSTIIRIFADGQTNVLRQGEIIVDNDRLKNT